MGPIDNLYLDLPFHPDSKELKEALEGWEDEPPGPRIDPRAARRVKFGDCLPELGYLFCTHSFIPPMLLCPLDQE